MTSRRRLPPRFPQRDGFDWKSAAITAAIMTGLAIVLLVIVHVSLR